MPDPKVPPDDDVIERWIETIEMVGRGLTDWEDEFMENIRAQWDLNRSLSPNRLEILERIYAEKTPL